MGKLKKAKRTVGVPTSGSPEVITEASYFARKCGLTIEEALALILQSGKADKKQKSSPRK
ncbi:hypothetical protein FKO01_45995 [Mesorhizobium sp. B2-3-3]|uniref:hypothetical protein n=1 Tax=unclassified Mesorhizobium TaxID=325217 RepID=UPI00112C8402|nr:MULTISPECIES: hypothetical protein [unclassified Mesorhizobium]TPK60643.1 hypothetical protein FJ930_28245 [Mesorhizobium sp. B2-4-15]TPM25355.1 hypothetical protein FJ958_21960 [Mesorhizobium sp. B2-3-5]TPN05840.1 hypothetical protein FKO01_45995 [Mesorhizobium sp. B2-3-3]